MVAKRSSCGSPVRTGGESTTRSATKRTLASVSHAIEDVAAVVGRGAVVIAFFQEAAYFAPMAPRYERLAGSGATVVVAHRGGGSPVPGVHQVELDPSDPRGAEWTLVLISDSVSAHLCAVDLVVLDPTATDLESGRVFEAQWGFDRRATLAHAQRVLAGLTDELPAEVASRIASTIDTAGRTLVTAPEQGLSAAAALLSERVESGERRLAAVRARLAAETTCATRDPLTGLLNREGIQRWLGGSVTDGLPMPEIGVVMLDLDGFKCVNDTYGHDTGDRLLVAVGDALRSAVRPADVVARWGGDEFVVLCPDVDEPRLARIAQRLVAAVTRVRVDEDAAVGASAGIATCSRRPLPLSTVDAALYRAKREGGGVVIHAT
jgi:diguanylate cyclase (GGDEF)-like protein